VLIPVIFKIIRLLQAFSHGIFGILIGAAIVSWHDFNWHSTSVGLCDSSPCQVNLCL